jgi:hypothetical protein
MPVLNAGDVAPWQAGTFFDVALAEVREVRGVCRLRPCRGLFHQGEGKARQAGPGE